MSTPKPKPEPRIPRVAAATAAAPPAASPAGSSSVATFPEDSREQERRGPGRPPKLCATCGKSATECKCAKAAAVPELAEQTVKQLLKGIFRTTGGAIAIATGVEMSKMQQVWDLAEGELMLLGPQATTLANKYADDFLKLFQTEIAFAVTILPIVAMKASATRTIVAAHKAANSQPKKDAAPPSPVPKAPDGVRAAAA